VARGRQRWALFEAHLAGRGPPASFPRAYRQICRDLAVARQRQLDAHVVDYLNGLALAGHQQLYRPAKASWRRIIDFAARDLPRAVRAEGRLILLCHLLFYGATFGIGLLVRLHPELVYTVLDPGAAQAIEAMYNPEAQSYLNPRDSDSDAAMFGFYIFNNVSIAFRTFGSGLFCGLGSLFLLVYNGIFFGAVAGHLANQGFADTLAAFVIGHGSFELTAIIISAAAGLRLGWSVTAPGALSRRESLRQAARRLPRKQARRQFRHRDIQPIGLIVQSEVVRGLAAAQGCDGGHHIGDHALAIRRTLGLTHLDTCARRQHGVGENIHIARYVVVRLDADRIAAAVDKHIVVHRHPTLCLQQRFAGIVQEEVAVDQIAVLAAGSRQRNMPQQDVGARLRTGQCVLLGKHIVADHRVVAIRIFT